MSENMKGADAPVGYKTSFERFIRYIDYQKSIDSANIHWRPQNMICKLCTMNYTYITHIEGLEFLNLSNI